MRFKLSRKYLNKNKIIDENTYLIFEENSWDDYGYNTVFEAYYRDKSSGLPIHFGNISIADLSITENMRKLNINRYKAIDKLEMEFNQLGSEIVTLGNDEYYENLNKLIEDKKIDFNLEDIMIALNDLAYNLKLLDEVKEYEVIKVSFFRRSPIQLVKGKLNRLARGITDSIAYKFYLEYFSGEKSIEKYEFSTNPNDLFPTNIYAIIGNNGSGKTRLLYDIYNSSLKQDQKIKSEFYNEENQLFVKFTTEEIENSQFLGTNYLSFSPFDNSNNRIKTKDEYKNEVITGNDIQNNNWDMKFKVLLGDMRSDSAKKRKFWILIKNFEFIFEILLEEKFNTKNMNKEEYLNFREKKIYNNEEQLFEKLKESFIKLSSGEKITLLGIVFLIVRVEERRLVLIDEPELFLHPPLLSDYIRVISNIMVDKNGLAIIVTHSPIILQEVINKNIYISKKNDQFFKLEKVFIPTFGENISVLTNEVFGLDISKSGFYKFIDEYISKKNVKVNDLKKMYCNELLGSEAKFYLAMKINELNMNKDSDNYVR